MISEDLNKLKSVFVNPEYVLFTLFVSVLFFSFYSLLLNYNLLLSFLANGSYALFVQMLPLLIMGFLKSTSYFSIALLALTSFFVGLNFSLAVFKVVKMSGVGAEGLGSIGGVLLAVIGPACPACATAVFASAGLSTLFAVLPFGGLEIKVLSLLLLIASAWYITRQIDNEVCKLCQI